MDSWKFIVCKSNVNMNVYWIDDCFVSDNDPDTDLNYIYKNRDNINVLSNFIFRHDPNTINYNERCFFWIFNYVKERDIGFTICNFEYAFEHWDEIFSYNLVLLDIHNEYCDIETDPLFEQYSSNSEEQANNAEEFKSDYGIFLYNHKTMNYCGPHDNFYFLSGRTENINKFAERHNRVDISRIWNIPKAGEINPEWPNINIITAIEKYLSNQTSLASNLSSIMWNMLRNKAYESISIIAREANSTTFPHHLLLGGDPRNGTEENILYNQKCNQLMVNALKETDSIVLQLPLHWGQYRINPTWEKPPVRSFFDSFSWLIPENADGRDLTAVFFMLRNQLQATYSRDVNVNFAIKTLYNDPNVFLYDYLYFNAPALATAIEKLIAALPGLIQRNKKENFEGNEEPIGYLDIQIEETQDNNYVYLYLRMHQYLINTNLNIDNRGSTIDKTQKRYYKLIDIKFPDEQAATGRVLDAYNLIKINVGGTIEKTGRILLISIKQKKYCPTSGEPYYGQTIVLNREKDDEDISN